jgi:hypothetical protein
MPCLRIMLGTKIKLFRFRTSVDRINRTVQAKTLEIEDHILNQEIVDVEKKVVRRVDREIKTTQTKPVTVVASVEGVEKIFTRNQSNALLGSRNVTDVRKLDIGQACADHGLTLETTTTMFRQRTKTQAEMSPMLFKGINES